MGQWLEQMENVDPGHFGEGLTGHNMEVACDLNIGRIAQLVRALS